MKRVVLIYFCMASFASSGQAQEFAAPFVDKLGTYFTDPKGAAIAALANGSLVFSGGWTSGGGELMDNRSNPWFLQALHERIPRVVSYCLVREANYPLSLHALYGAVSGALSFWRDQFYEYDAGEGTYYSHDFYLGREIFQWDQTCSGNSDQLNVDALPQRLIFQFGFLSSLQEQKLNKLGKYKENIAGIAVRTGYDEKALQGKGFIYISSQASPSLPTAVNINQNQVQRALIHELGHVYGLSHFGISDEIMNEDYPHQVLSENDSSHLGHLQNVIVSLNKKLKTICFSGLAAKFFSIENESRGCLSYQFIDGRTIALVLTHLVETTSDGGGVMSVITKSSLKKDLGQIKLNENLELIDIAKTIRAVTNKGLSQVLEGPKVAVYAASAVYEAADGSLQPVTVRFSPKNLELGVLIDEVMYYNIFSQSLIETNHTR